VTSQPQSRQKVERRFLESLRSRYEGEGFTFTTYPYPAKLPDFLGSYVPDALAQKPGRNVVIEVKQRSAPPTERSLAEISRLFDGHPDWQLQVVLMGGPLQSVAIPVAKPATVRSGIKEVRALIQQGHRRAAFVVAWSLLEAALRALDDETNGHSFTPGIVVQTLAMNGYIEPETEGRMRNLIELRNRIVHGDLVAEPAQADVELVLSAIEETLSGAASKKKLQHRASHSGAL
jgi:uncharacterized protein YutE (UPF0331/DUF86 family)